MTNVRRIGAVAAAVFTGYILTSPAVIADTSPSPGPASSARTSPSPSATPVQAKIALSPNSAPPGGQVTVSGSGFPAGIRIDLYLDVPAQVLFPIGYSADSRGAFVFVVTINGSPGDHGLCADTYATPQPSQVKACAPLVVTNYQPKITVTPDSGPPDTLVRLVGTGFPANEVVALYVESPIGLLSTPGPRADGQGNFAADARMLNRDAGPQSICGDTGPLFAGNQQYAVKACVQFTLTGTTTVPPSPAQSPPPTASSAPTFAPSPTSAHAVSPGIPVWPIAGGAALLAALGAGAFFWFRRRTQLKDR